MLITKDPMALKVEALASASGIHIRAGVKPGDLAIGCVRELLFWAERDYPTLTKIWPLLLDIINHGGMVSQHVLRGLIFIEQNMENKHSITETRWRKRLNSIPYITLMEAIASYVRIENATAPVCARGILAVLNKGLRHRLMVKGINA